MTISMRQLRYLVALDRAGTFRRAAESCGVSQPSLSEQIKAMEASLGLALADRTRPRVHLTPAGREIAQRARAILAQVDELEGFATRMGEGFSGTIRLGATLTAGPYLLPHVVARLHRDYPDLRLYVREAAPARLVEDLLAGAHDLILTQLPVMVAGLETRRILREPLYLGLAADAPLASRAVISRDDLKGLDVIGLGPEYQLYHHIRRLCEDNGARLVQDYQGTSLDAVRQMVGMGMGASFFPALYLASEAPGRSEIVARPVSGPPITRSLGLVWRERSAGAPAFETLAGIMREVGASVFADVRREN